MSAIDVQVRFAAEFALFLVSFAGVGFTFLRADLLVVRPLARAASAVGFAAMAVASFLGGALILDDPTSPGVVTLRYSAIVLLGAASLAWRPDHRGRELLRIGLVALMGAEVFLAGDETSSTADIARVIGALAIGACLLVASGRVISARIAASGALVLLAVITVVAVALSAVVSNNIEDEALRRHGARAGTEATTISSEGTALLPSVKLIATALGAPSSNPDLNALRRVTDPVRAPVAADQNVVGGIIDVIVQQFVADVDPQRGPTLVVDESVELVVATPPGFDDALLRDLRDHASVRESLENQAPVPFVALAGGRLVAAATEPLVVQGGDYRGVVVRTTFLDATYLERRTAPIGEEDPGVGLAVVDRDRVLSDSGTHVSDELLRDLGRVAIDSGEELDRALDDRFLTARPILGPNDAPVAALLLSAPRNQEDETRDDLFRVLFLVAMGAAAAALVLAGVAGERIGSGLRKLTEAAAAIRAGNLDARAQVTSDDELGELGSSFDAMAASLRDLTADLRTSVLDEAALRARLEAVFKGMGEALVAVDAEGDVTDFNTAAEELFDLPSREAVGRPVGEVVHLRSQDGTNISRRLRRPVVDPWSEAGTVRISGGRDVPVAVSAGALRGPDDEVIGAVFVFRDQRRERELDRMKTEFLSNISHELRTPLTPIKGFAAILQTRDLPAAKARAFADEISTAADQLERVIGQLVNFATITGGRLAISPERMAVRPIIDASLKGWKDRVEAKHKLSRRVAAGIPRVMADPSYVAQAVDELIANAVKYSPDGGKIVVAASVVEGEDGPELAISVRDEGVGIPPDRLDTVLDDFAQADASATRRFGGLGLGLSLVQRIARAHGGDVRLSSAPNMGTTVAVSFPLDGPPDGGAR